jgi:adenylate cyclase
MRYLPRMSRVTIDDSVLLPVDIATAWRRLADTNALNRVAGLSHMTLEPAPASTSAARFIGRTSYGGVPARFEELPFTWEHERSFGVERRMLGGPMERVQTRFSLAPEASGARLNIRIDVDVVTALLNPITRLQTQRSVDALLRAATQLSGAPDPLAAPAGTAPGEGPLSAALARLRPRAERPDLAERLAAWVATTDDLSAARMRPYALADAWGVPRRALLATCLAATEAGLLELSWELVCPGCRNGTAALPRLSAIVQDEGDCHACEVRFRLDAEGAVEAIFRPHPAVRRVDTTPFCSGGPLKLPHVVAQAVVPAGGEARLRAPDQPGHHRASVRGAPAVEVDVIPGASDEVEAREGARVAVAPGGYVRVRNATGEERHARLERADGPRDGASVRDVVTLPRFRAAFSGDTLRPGFALTVGRVALFFSDLADSTRLYERVGDATAFKLVQDHFELVEGILKRHGGTIVKTIGDAVMAAFSDDAAAVRASVEILAAFEPFRQADDVRAQTHIKLGVYAGACYAVTANGTLDYFGQAVNVAARLQGLARSGELVLDAALAPLAAQVEGAVLADPEDASLKGVSHAMRVVRVRAGGA